MVRLPILIDKVEGISKNASIILQKMPRNKELSRMEIEKISGFDKYKTLRELEELMSEGLVKKVGRGRATKYIKI